MSKRYLLITLFFLVVTCTIGCSATTEEVVEDPKPMESMEIELRFAWWGSEARHRALEEVIRLFEAEFPGVRIIPEYSSWDGYGANLLSALSAGVEADIVQVNYNWIHAFGKGNNVFYNLIDLNEYIELSSWEQSYLDAMTTDDGQLAAVPWGMTGRVPLVNQSVFDAFDVPIPRTYLAAKDAAQIIAENNTQTEGENHFVFLNVGMESLDLFIGQMLLNHTGKVMQTGGIVNYTEDEVMEALALFLDLEASGATPNYYQDDVIQNEYNPDWLLGRAGMIFEWTSSMEKYIDVFGEESAQIVLGDFFRFHEEDTPTIYVKPSFGYAISRRTAHPEIAAQFIEFLFTNEQAVQAINTQLGLSSNTRTLEFQQALGMLDGLMGEAIALLDSYPQVVMDPFFEDHNVRAARYQAIDSLRIGAVDLRTAARMFIEGQQNALDELFAP